jgi:hypothetical protein
MKATFVILLVIVAFVVGVLISPKMSVSNWTNIDWHAT